MPSTRFPQTRWSVVLAARDVKDSVAQAALTDLCQIYWKPIYGFCRQMGNAAEDAEDLTQAFFVKLIEKDFLAKAESKRGRLRSYLLILFKRFLNDQNEKAQAIKRGGEVQFVPVDAEDYCPIRAGEVSSPEAQFDRRWALSVLEAVIEKLRKEYHDEGKEELFSSLEGFLSGRPSVTDYGVIAGALEMKESTVRVAVFRLRRRYGELLRIHVADTVDSPEEIVEELNFLMNALSQ